MTCRGHSRCVKIQGWKVRFRSASVVYITSLPRWMSKLNFPLSVAMDLDVIGDDVDLTRGFVADEPGKNSADDRGHTTISISATFESSQRTGCGTLRQAHTLKR